MTTNDTCSHDYLNKPIDYWLQYLQDRNPLLRRLGAHALSVIGPEGGSKAVHALTTTLDDPESYVRVWAAAALARVEPSHARALSTLIAGMRDAQSFVRSLSAWHLGRLGPGLPNIENAVPMLQELLEDENPSVRAEAEVALKAIQAESARARD